MKSKTIKIWLRSILIEELTWNSEDQSLYLTGVLNNLYKFLKGVFIFSKSGNYLIDNNASERII